MYKVSKLKIKGSETVPNWVSIIMKTIFKEICKTTNYIHINLFKDAFNEPPFVL